MTPPNETKMPELPVAAGFLLLHNQGGVSQVHGYTAKQMHAYAEATLAAAAGGREDVRCYVAEKKESCDTGPKYWVTIERDGKRITPYHTFIRGRAEYEVATWNHVLNGAPEPNILDYDTGALTDTLPDGSLSRSTVKRVTALASPPVEGQDDNPHEFGANAEPNPKAKYWQYRARVWQNRAIELGWKITEDDTPPEGQSVEQRADAVAALRALRLAYVRLLESGRDRIRDLGGQCDPVDVMERNDHDLRKADEAIAALTAQAPSEPDPLCVRKLASCEYPACRCSEQAPSEAVAQERVAWASTGATGKKVVAMPGLDKLPYGDYDLYAAPQARGVDHG